MRTTVFGKLNDPPARTPKVGLKPPALRAVVVSRASVRLRNPIPLTRRVSMVSINCFIDRARRSSFHTMSVSPLRATSSDVAVRTVDTR